MDVTLPPPGLGFRDGLKSDFFCSEVSMVLTQPTKAFKLRSTPASILSSSFSNSFFFFVRQSACLGVEATKGKRLSLNCLSRRWIMALV